MFFEKPIIDRTEDSELSDEEEISDLEIITGELRRGEKSFDSVKELEVEWVVVGKEVEAEKVEEPEVPVLEPVSETIVLVNPQPVKAETSQEILIIKETIDKVGKSLKKKKEEKKKKIDDMVE